MHLEELSLIATFWGAMMLENAAPAFHCRYVLTNISCMHKHDSALIQISYWRSCFPYSQGDAGGSQETWSPRSQSTLSFCKVSHQFPMLRAQIWLFQLGMVPSSGKETPSLACPALEKGILQKNMKHDMGCKNTPITWDPAGAGGKGSPSLCGTEEASPLSSRVSTETFSFPLLPIIINCILHPSLKGWRRLVRAKTSFIYTDEETNA